MYFSDQFNKYKNDILSTWKVINKVLRSNKNSEPTKEISHNGEIIEDPAVMAELFNNYFVQIGTKLSENIPEPDRSFTSFLKNPNPQSIFLTPILEHEIKDIVNILKCNKSPGSDELTNFLLKNVINEILSPLTYIFNLSLCLGF